MKNKAIIEFGYTVYPFMMNLGLSARETMAYALIYSFTLGSEGFYYGKRKTMASALSSSQRTLGRTIDSLISKGLIEIHERHGVKGLRATKIDPVAVGKKGRNYKTKSKGDNAPKKERAEKGSYQRQKKNAPADAGADKEEIDSSSDFTYFSKGYSDTSDNALPRYNTLTLGRYGAIMMSREQYEKLSSLVPASVLAGYFASFEDMLNANSVTHHRPPRNHYRTIRKWIEEDMRV